jgi:peptidoglycan/LPS O-acetylase OafA/YrhL
VAGQVLRAWRLRRDSRWRRLAGPLAAAAVAAAGLLVAFYAGPHDSWDGTLQRIAVSLPLAAVAAVAVRLAQLSSVTGQPPSDRADGARVAGAPRRC